jgi:hypothetical protein
LHSYILNVVLVRRDDTPLKDIHALAHLSKDVISSFSYFETEGGSDNPVLKFEKTLISTFLDFIIFRGIEETGSELIGLE